MLIIKVCRARRDSGECCCLCTKFIKPGQSYVRTEGSSLQMRQETWLETEVESEAQTATQTGERDCAAVNKASSQRRGNQNTRKAKRHDPNLDHESVKTYRELFRLCPSFYWRQAIVLTVGDDTRKQAEWKRILKHWKTQKWNPLDVKHQLSEFDRLVSFKNWKPL